MFRDAASRLEASFAELGIRFFITLALDVLKVGDPDPKVFTGFFFVRGIVLKPDQVSLLYMLAGFSIGLFLWSLSEYLLHRFVFHYKPKNAWQERVTFLFHGIHHVQPQCKTRLVMPPIVSVPLAFVFYGLFTLVVGQLLNAPQWVAPLFAGFIVGYVCYDMIHYATHHAPNHSAGHASPHPSTAQREDVFVSPRSTACQRRRSTHRGSQ